MCGQCLYIQLSKRREQRQKMLKSWGSKKKKIDAQSEMTRRKKEIIFKKTLINQQFYTLHGKNRKS